MNKKIASSLLICMMALSIAIFASVVVGTALSHVMGDPVNSPKPHCVGDPIDSPKTNSLYF